MKRILYVIVIMLMVFSLTACAAPAAEQTGETTATPAPTTAQDAIAGASADELRGMITRYNSEGNYEMAYAAAKRLIELEPSDTDAYTAAMDALAAISAANYEEINILLAQGVESAEDAQVLAEWADENQPDYSIELPFISDYKSDEINTVGTMPGNLCNDFYRPNECWETGLFASQGDWVYFSRPDEGFAIYKMRTDGTKFQRVGENGGSCINVVGDWIYFRLLNNDEMELYKMRTDGSEPTQVSENWCDYISVSGDFIYYGNGSDDFRVYRIRTDGSDDIALTEKQAIYMCVYGDWVYYSLTDESGFYRTLTDGSETEKLSDRYVGIYCISGDWIYYSIRDDNNAVQRMRLDGSEDEEVLRCDQARCHDEHCRGYDGSLLQQRGKRRPDHHRRYGRL